MVNGCSFIEGMNAIVNLMNMVQIKYKFIHNLNREKLEPVTILVLTGAR